MPHFIPIKGDKARRYIDSETNLIISRRRYDQLYGRLGRKGYTYEHAARLAKVEDLAEALARPARGRKKISSENEKNLRLVKFFEDKEKRKILRQQKKIKELGKVKKYPQKSFQGYLKKGKKAHQIKFPLECEPLFNYIDIIRRSKFRKDVFAVAIQLECYSLNKDESFRVTLYPMYALSMRDPSCDDLFDSVEEKTSLNPSGTAVPLYFVLHIAYEDDYIQRRNK